MDPRAGVVVLEREGFIVKYIVYYFTFHSLVLLLYATFREKSSCTYNQLPCYLDTYLMSGIVFHPMDRNDRSLFKRTKGKDTH